jgi:hypothetical protein
MNEKIARLIKLNVELLKQYAAMQKTMTEIYSVLKELKPKE